MKPTPFLDFYKQSLIDGEMSLGGGSGDALGGLCSTWMYYNKHFKLFIPDGQDWYWGYGDGYNDANGIQLRKEFTPLRQTIVLFCAAINGELLTPHRTYE